MTFEEDIKKFAKRAVDIKDNISTEEATKTSLVMPLFQLLGYDVFNPAEFTPEYTADVGIKKGEKVDYAIMSDEGNPTILIEAKSVNEELTKHDSQLFRYFGTSAAKFAILTNGIIYKFYTDLEETNKMDSSPFLEVNVCELKDSHILELQKFHKEFFNVENILDSASDLKYIGAIKSVLRDEFTNPSENFVKFILNSGVYDGNKTQNIIEKDTPLVKRCISIYVGDLVNDRLKNALNSNIEHFDESHTVSDESTKKDLIITTEEELESYYIVKALLKDVVDVSRISYKDTQTYFVILLDNKITKWICRVYIKENTMYLVIPNDNEDLKYVIKSLDDIYDLKEALLNRTSSLLS